MRLVGGVSVVTLIRGSVGLQPRGWKRPGARMGDSLLTSFLNIYGILLSRLCSRGAAAMATPGDSNAQAADDGVADPPPTAVQASVLHAQSRTLALPVLRGGMVSPPAGRDCGALRPLAHESPAALPDNRRLAGHR